MPYALFLASCSMGSLIFLIVPQPYVPLCLLVVFITFLEITPWGLWLPFYLGYSPIELWDSLSALAQPEIVCLASQASDWLCAFWASLSGLQPSVTLAKLLVIGHFLRPLG